MRAALDSTSTWIDQEEEGHYHPYTYVYTWALRQNPNMSTPSCSFFLLAHK